MCRRIVSLMALQALCDAPWRGFRGRKPIIGVGGLMEQDTVRITVERLDELLEIEAKMAALKSLGVEQWPGYDKAMRVW